MAGEAGHLVGLVRQVFVEDAGAKGELASIGARFRHQLGPRRLHVEARVIAVDAVFDQAHFPFEGRVDDRTLDKDAAAVVARHPFEAAAAVLRSEEHTSELQSLMRISYAVFCLKKKKQHTQRTNRDNTYSNT